MHLCMQGAIIAAHQAVIAGDALGMGSCYVGDIAEKYEEVQKLLNLPSHAIPAAMVIMGKSLSPNAKVTTVADYYYNRKYSSEFMD